MDAKPTRSNVFELIKQAIFEQRCVSAVYHDRRRDLCPHVLGWKDGREHVLFFQVGGESEKGLASSGSWRCLNLEELTDIETSDSEFRTGPGYFDNPQKCVDKVEAQIPALRVVVKRATV